MFTCASVASGGVWDVHICRTFLSLLTPLGVNDCFSPLAAGRFANPSCPEGPQDANTQLHFDAFRLLHRHCLAFPSPDTPLNPNCPHSQPVLTSLTDLPHWRQATRVAARQGMICWHQPFRV